MYLLFRLLKLLFVIGLIYALYKMLWKGEPLFGKRKQKPHPQAALEEMKKDPICGTYLPERQALQLTSGGETHYFCSEECKNKFAEQLKK
jgi:YHS domain-containing protein